MNCSSQTSVCDFPDNPSHIQNIYKVEETAAKALRNINSIYNEIMTPKEYHAAESDVLSKNMNNTSHSISNHYVKNCCSTLRELCIKCDKYISKCSTCSRCNCGEQKSNLKKVENTEILENDDCLDKPINGQSNDNSKIKCTVPEPFTLYMKSKEQQKAKEEKILKLKQELDSKIDNELKIRANCKPVPKTTHLPLYDQMVQEKEKHKIERKEKCLEILNSAKPFNLHASKRGEKLKPSSNEDAKHCFKAKPVPKHILSNEISEKLKNKEKVRKMLMGERAMQLKEKASLPFSNKSVTMSRSLIDLYNLNKTENKEQVKAKNISEITKRLYVKKCNETINNWNKKVLLVDTDKNIENKIMQGILMKEHLSLAEKQCSKIEELPFMYFPVRMSNAALLREKRIRAEILAREERERRQKQEEELAKKNTNADILQKLQHLIPTSDSEKEIDQKVKSFRESQIKRRHEYKKELEEIMKRVAEQNLLLERQSKLTKESSPAGIKSVHETSQTDNERSQSPDTAVDSEVSETESADNDSPKPNPSNNKDSPKSSPSVLDSENSSDES